MANLKIATADYDELDTFLGEGRSLVTIGNNTSLMRTAHLGRDAIAVVLHSTKVVTVDDLGNITLDTGGWDTVTTKDRINAFLGDFLGDVYVCHRQGRLYLGIRSAGGPETLHDFYDGITLDQFGNLLSEARAAA